MQLKNGIYVALICFAMIPAYAQNATRVDRTANAAATTPVQDYVDQVNGLLRDVHATLQQISERIEAGELTAQQAQALKLAATRAMIARLETISAVYDASLRPKHAVEDAGSVPSADSGEDAQAHLAIRANDTISVQELERRSR